MNILREENRITLFLTEELRLSYLIRKVENGLAYINKVYKAKKGKQLEVLNIEIVCSEADLIEEVKEDAFVNHVRPQLDALSLALGGLSQACGVVGREGYKNLLSEAKMSLMNILQDEVF